MSKHHTSHGVHLFLSIITLGLWLPVWAWMSCQNILIKEKTVTYGPDVAQVAIVEATTVPTHGHTPEVSPVRRRINAISLGVILAVVALIVIVAVA